MGRIGLMGQALDGTPDYMLMDLFHYTGAGARGLNNGAGRFFSINNGTALLKGFNNQAGLGGDLADWASGTNDSFNAFTSTGVKNDLTTVDLQVMDAIGYDRVTCCPSDVNADGQRDGRDIAGFTRCLLNASIVGDHYQCADMNGSGVVDATDLPLFIAAILTGGPC